MNNNLIKALYGKVVGGLVALGMLFVFIIMINPVLSYIGTTLGLHSLIGGVLSLVFLFGWLVALIVLPIYIAKKVKYIPKAK